VVDAALERAFLRDRDLPRNKTDFEARLAEGRPKLHAIAQDLARRLGPILEDRARIAARIEHPRSTVERETYADLQTQLAYLFPPGFILELSDQRLRHYPRYLKAQALRLDKLPLAPGKDAQKLAELTPFWRVFTEQHAPGEDLDPEAEELRWMLEEFRVSLFAQELGTAKPVSPKRLRSSAFWMHRRG
jgi:ATP-dependent helicase HrpA